MDVEYLLSNASYVICFGSLHLVVFKEKCFPQCCMYFLFIFFTLTSSNKLILWSSPIYPSFLSLPSRLEDSHAERAFGDVGGRGLEAGSGVISAIGYFCTSSIYLCTYNKTAQNQVCFQLAGLWKLTYVLSQMVVFVCHLKAVGGAGTRGGDTGCKQLCSLDPCSCVWAPSVPVSSSAALPRLPAHVHTATIAPGRAPGAVALCPCCPCGFAWVPCVDAAGVGGGESLKVSGWCYHTRHCSAIAPLSVGAACRRG